MGYIYLYPDCLFCFSTFPGCWLKEVVAFPFCGLVFFFLTYISRWKRHKKGRICVCFLLVPVKLS